MSYPSWTEARAFSATDKSGTMQQVSTFTDGLGREVKAAAQSDDGSVAKTVYVCKQYDAKGRVTAESNPTYTDCGNGSGLYARSFYDGQGRLLYQTFDDGRPRVDYLYSGPHTINGDAMTLLTAHVSAGAQARDDLTYTDSRGRTRRRLTGTGADT